MRKVIMSAIVLLFLSACSGSVRNKAIQYYNKHPEAFTQRQQRNGFTLQCDFIPATAMSASPHTMAREVDDLYHFRLQVFCPAQNDLTTGNKTALLYGVDTLFSLGKENQSVLPLAVEPVPTGSTTRFEYLVTISRKDLKPGKQLEIVYRDRLFTNTTMSFVFDRTQIDELDKIYS